MIRRIKEALKDFPKECNLSACTPAADNFFHVNELAELLALANRQSLHKIVAKHLFIASRAHPDKLKYH